MIILPGPVVLRDPLPPGWRRCSSLGCGAPTGHDGAHVPEAVPPRPVAPAGRWVRRCTARSDCGRPAGHAPPCVPTRSDCTCGPYDPESRCTWCDGLVWQAAAAPVAVAGPEVDVGAELRPPRCVCGHAQAQHAPALVALGAVAGQGGDGECWHGIAGPNECGCVRYQPARSEVPIPAVAGPEVDVAAEAAPTRAERIEAAARALLAADGVINALEWDGNNAAVERLCVALEDLRAALCSCTAAGPDLACLEHGAAIRAWQARNGT